MTTTVDARPAVILLIEDDKGDQELTRRSLEKGKIKNDLYIVENGEQALDYLFRRGKYSDPALSPRPDLVLLDLNLPKIDGRKVLEEIRNTDELKTLVVVIMTTSNKKKTSFDPMKLGKFVYYQAARLSAICQGSSGSGTLLVSSGGSAAQGEMNR